MKDLQAASAQARAYVADCQALLDQHCPGRPRLPVPAALKTCFVEVDFEALADETTRRRFLDMPTTFKLPPGDIDELIAVAGRLLQESAAFQRLLRALAGAPASTAPDADPNCT
jgi:hypothetical protein